MHKNQKKKAARPKVQPAPPKPLAPLPALFGISFKIKCYILLAIGFVFYINTVGNEYALDDGIVIVKNQYVQDGISGIGKIMSTDAYDSYYRQMHASQMLAGGRYRPLSIVVFAIEHSIFGESWPIRHFISVLFYMACVVSIFYFLSKFLLKRLPYGEDMAFVAAILFAIHPLHTEVVANVKSLDEIMSLLLIMCTFIFSLRYMETKKTGDLVLGLTAYFLSLLAKEYAAMLVILIPLAFYLLSDKKPVDAFLSSIPYYAVFGLYMLFRIGAVGIPKNVPGGEILNNPYMLATHSQKIATEWLVMGKYIKMLFLPYPLSSDYSYNTIPYHNLSDLSVIISILIYVALIIWGIWLTVKKNILAFPVFFFLLNLFMVSNFLVDIGATMGERLAFHSSLGFVVLIAYGLFYLTRKMKATGRRNIYTACMVILVVACAAECIPRNAQWKNDVTLFTHDVHVVPNSAMVLGNAGARYIDLAEKSKDNAKTNSYLREAIRCLAKSITLDKQYTNSYLNLGVAYYRMNEPDSAKIYWDIAKRIYPDHPNLKVYYPLLAESYLNKGIAIGKNGNLQAGIDEMVKGEPYAGDDAGFWYNLGGAYFTIKNYGMAKAVWDRALQIKPDYSYTDKNNQKAFLKDLVNSIFTTSEPQKK